MSKIISHDEDNNLPCLLQCLPLLEPDLSRLTGTIGLRGQTRLHLNFISTSSNRTPPLFLEITFHVPRVVRPHLRVTMRGETIFKKYQKINSSMTKCRPISDGASTGDKSFILDLFLALPSAFCQHAQTPVLHICFSLWCGSCSSAPHADSKYSPSVSTFCLLLTFQSFLIQSIHYWGILEVNEFS